MHYALRVGLILTLLAMAGGPLLLAPGSANKEAPAVVFTEYPRIEPRGYVCHRAWKPVVIDGKIDEPAWESAAWSEDFIDIEGANKPRPAQRTRMKMLWDDEYLYIGAQLDEKHVWATLTKHDSIIFIDNDFEVFIDPDSDSHLYAELEINALNTTWDLLLPRPYKNGGKAIDAWEIPGLKTAVHVDGTINDPRDVDRGWSVEIAWPWASLKEITYRGAVPPRDQDQWRINFSRVQWQHEVVDGKYRKIKGKPEDNWVWSPQGAIDMHRPERWGIVQFSDRVPGDVKFRPDPTGEFRYLLHRVYYAQWNYRKVHGKWAGRLEDLKLTGAEFKNVKLETTQAGFQASMPEPVSIASHWHIRSDGRIWSESSRSQSP
jgi:Carbohydrate family 9 binding domain-like